ncbi:DUF742 domain-containing protein [Streptomyces sp. NBC_00663]|uniref:DUF742 domain-containing protein n=1 Tax=Streptomyces sp. NBC_00663 TaxID=2975801 RepID=UPI002E3645EC|nr:DUF742 domain-containing protein [Streptomyces sp. NBC_00663]
MSGPRRNPRLPAENAGGAFVRPFLLTRGRVHARHWLSPETLVEAGPGRAGPELAEGEYGQLVQLCRGQRRSVAELAGTTRLPLTTARVLLSDLLDARVLVLSVTAAYTPAGDPDSKAGDRPTAQLLEAVRAGLARKWSDVPARAC